LWDNPHKLSLKVRPDPEFLNERNEFEAKLLKRLDADLSESDKSSLVVAAEQLVESQNSVQDSDILPTLQISDIAKEQDHTPYTSVSDVSGVSFHVIE
jgi:Zn-dependent M16 (insulinase) family peptidase